MYLNPDIIIFEIGSNDLCEISVTHSSSEFVSHWLVWQTFYFVEYGVSVCVMCQIMRRIVDRCDPRFCVRADYNVVVSL